MARASIVATNDSHNVYTQVDIQNVVRLGVGEYCVYLTSNLVAAQAVPVAAPAGAYNSSKTWARATLPLLDAICPVAEGVYVTTGMHDANDVPFAADIKFNLLVMAPAA